MEREVDLFLKRLSLISITIASLTLLFLFFLLHTTATSCVPPHAPLKHQPHFPNSTCDSFPTRPHAPLHKKLTRLHSTRDWRRRVQSFTSLFQPLLHRGLLGNDSKVLCVSAGAGHEVAAAAALGVEDVTGVELVESPPLVRRADPHNLPFFDGAFDLAFSARLDEALFPARFAAEMERTVRAGGTCVVAVGECGDEEVREVARLFRNSRFVGASNVTLVGMRMTTIILRTTKSS